MNGDHQSNSIAPHDTKAKVTKSTGKKKRTKRLKPTLELPLMPALQVDTEDNAQHLTISYHFQNGHINLNSSTDLQTQTMNNDKTAAKNLKNNSTPSLSICNMCSRNDDVCINVQHNHGTVLTVSDMTRLPSWNIREILTSVCSRCLVYISTLTESSSKLRLRCEQAIHHQTVALAPPTPDTSPNNFLQTTISLLDESPGHSNNLQHRNRYAPGYCDDTDISDLPASPPLQTSEIFAAAPSRSPSPNNPGQNSMLQIHHERPVSPLNTESGGGGKNSKRSYQRVSVIPVQMICSYCNRAYWRKDYYNKHMRRCGAKNRYAKSLGATGTRARSASRLDFIETVSVISEGEEQITTVNQPRVFHCNNCAVTVDTIGKLREHKQIHLPRYYCDICSNSFTTVIEYDFHRAECTAKLEVFEKGLENLRNDIISPHPMPARRKTRSYSRAVSVAPSLAPTRAGSARSTKKKPEKKPELKPEKKSEKKPEKISEKKPEKKREKKAETKPEMNHEKTPEKTPEKNSEKKPEQKPKRPPSKKSKANSKKEIKETQQDDVQSTITNFVKRNAELYTDKLEVIENNIEKDKAVEPEIYNNDHDDDDDDDDDVSEVDTLYSKRLSLTNHWVEEHSHSSHSHLSQGDNYIDDFIEDIPFKLFKEYDLYLLDRLKVEVKLNSLTCFVSECKFTTTTLTDMMVHDYIHHFKKSWFYCYKCGHCFTSKVFLDYHLDMQNKGRYVCFKCGGHFEYQHQLDRHFLQHARQTEDMMVKYVCQHCNYEFLDEDKLLKHCDDENHSCQKKKSYIAIDHSMTIANKVPATKTRRSKKYKVRYLNMVLKRMPSKRCIPMEKYRPNLPPHLQNPYIQNRIGRVEFRYSLNPNCVGCL